MWYDCLDTVQVVGCNKNSGQWTFLWLGYSRCAGIATSYHIATRRK